MAFDTDFFFTPGKLSIVADGTYGSSGKGSLASFLTEHADYQFACNTFSAQAGHWVRLDPTEPNKPGRTYFYQSLNSCAYQKDKYEKLYIGPDAAIEFPALMREIEENNIPVKKLGIHPLCTILQDKDSAYERGEVDYEGNPLSNRGDGTMKFGSTAHGVAPCRTRKMLRRQDTILAKDFVALEEMICDVEREIMDRLDKGQKGLLEIAQGFPLSLNYKFYPATTSRNVTVSAALDGMMLPPIYAGNVMLNFRTFPIRIANDKYIGDDGKFLTWAEIQQYDKEDKKYQIYKGTSGGWYDDQEETTWEEITKSSGAVEKIQELTSVTKMPRRVATWSKQCLIDAVKYNRTHGRMFISINFLNYVQNDILGYRGDSIKEFPKCIEWINKNLCDLDKLSAELKILGTGPKTDDKILF
jgi:adenylosuccinate synthase